MQQNADGDDQNGGVEDAEGSITLAPVSLSSRLDRRDGIKRGQIDAFASPFRFKETSK